MSPFTASSRDAPDRPMAPLCDCDSRPWRTIRLGEAARRLRGVSSPVGQAETPQRARVGSQNGPETSRPHRLLLDSSQSSPENRSQAACRLVPMAAPIRDQGTWFLRNRSTARCSWSSDCFRPAALMRSSSSSTSATSLSGPIESSRRRTSDWRTSLQSCTHWSHMNTPGPATSLRTLSSPLPQKEQRNKRRLLGPRESLRLNTCASGYPDGLPGVKIT